MSELNRELVPGGLNDAFRPVALAEGIGADSLDDIERLGRMGGLGLVPVLQRDLLDHIGDVIKSGAQRRLDLRREGG